MKFKAKLKTRRTGGYFINYEINNTTYQIRNKATKRLMPIYSSKDGHERVYVGITKCYNYVLAQQFIPNSDPKVYTEVNHKNHIIHRVDSKGVFIHSKASQKSFGASNGPNRVHC